MASLMIKNGIIVMNGSRRLLVDGAIYVEGARIVDVGKTGDLERAYSADEVIDASKGVVMPGLVNSHVHFTSVLRRGFDDDLTLEQWLGLGGWTRTLLPLGLTTQEEIAAVFRLVCLEMIKAGITCYSAGTGLLRERYETGLRSLNCLLVVGEIGDYKGVMQTIQEDYSDRCKFGFGTPYLPEVPEDVLLEVREVAERHNLRIDMHMAESRGEIQEIKKQHGCDGSIEYLDRLGLLSPRLIATHCVHVSPKEIELMQKRGVGVAHCPASNAKLGDGVAPLTTFLKAKIPVGLGTDGPATNNCIDLFQEMKLACLLQRAVHCDPTVVKAEDALKMATMGGARLLGMDSDIGSIEIGKKADLIIVNFEKPHLYPKTNLFSHLVYSAGASDVDTTIVGGKILMKNRKVLTVNEASVLKEAQEAYESISSKRVI